MSSDVIIEVSELAKIFPIYDKPHYRLMQMVLGSGRQWYREFSALKDVNFEIKRGETVGVVGRNGSGKSTLLQILCGTLAPSAGNVHVRGRVAALLELGAGFNPEFTGRENVFLNGTVLGLTRTQIAKKLDDILAFAEIGEFIDRPVKTYSSGMYVRLAFAVAIHVEPDLLVVDEALSVGDEAFQRKCYARIDKLRGDGCTVLFVSHSSGVVIELCDRAILLDRGEVLADGPPKTVISRYQRMLYAPHDRVDELRTLMKLEYLESKEGKAGDLQQSSGGLGQVSVVARKTHDNEAYYDESLRSQSEIVYPSQGASIGDAHLETLDGRRVNVLNAGERYVYTYHAHFERGTPAVRFGMLIKSVTGIEIAGSASATAQGAIEWVDAGATFLVRFEFRCDLAGSTYFMNAGVLGRPNEEETYLDRRIDVLMFRVVSSSERLATGFVDLVDAVTVESSQGAAFL
jgi:lipopolysaccharide transport system ATP-binding protein